MTPILTAIALLLVPCSVIAGVVFFLVYTAQGHNEKATMPLTLCCQKCGKVVYESRTGSTKEPFSAVVMCVHCASKKKFIKTYGPDAKVEEY